MYGFMSGLNGVCSSNLSCRIPDYLLTSGGPFECEASAASALVCPHCGMGMRLQAKSGSLEKQRAERFGGHKIPPEPSDVLDL